MKPIELRAWCVLFSLGALHCGEDDSTAVPDGSGGPPAEVSGDTPTFWQHVAPILEEKCVSCHQSGGIAPFPLDNFADAERRANQIVDMTENRIMPPYLMETGGECGDFDESAALTDEQIATIGAWVSGGKSEGVPGVMSAPALPSLEEGIDLYTPEFVPEIEGGPLAQFDEYRCFTVDMGLTDESFVTAFEFVPGNQQIVHHVIAMLVDPNAPSMVDGRTNAQQMAQLHETDRTPEREGWHCFGEAGEGIRVESAPGAWAPGAGVYRFPEGVGVRMQPDRVLVVQVHYNLARPEARGQSDRTRMRLEIKNSVERQALLLLDDAFLATLYNDPPDVLEPGNPAARYSWTRTGADLGVPPNVPVELFTVAPHMHERGRKFTIELGRNDAFECQGRINRWDFNWQRPYNYITPLVIDSDTQLRVSCEYDTSNDTEPVLPGWGTRNEMCEINLLVAFPPGVTF